MGKILKLETGPSSATKRAFIRRALKEAKEFRSSFTYIEDSSQLEMYLDRIEERLDEKLSNLMFTKD